MGPINTQLKWKLRYSPVHRRYLDPTTALFSDCRRNRVCLNLCLEFSAYSLIRKSLADACTTFVSLFVSYTSLNRENVHQKYRNRGGISRSRVDTLSELCSPFLKGGNSAIIVAIANSLIKTSISHSDNYGPKRKKIGSNY